MYNKSRKSLKALLVFVLAVVLLSNAILPITVKGSDNDASVDYQYYVVRSGDTLTKIAKNYGVTISDIMTANNMSNADKIITGKVIKVPLSSSGSSRSLVTTRLSLNLVKANIMDVLSAIALNAGYTVIFVSDSSTELTVNLEQMSALKALDYVTRLANLTYLKDGNTIMVGSADELNNTFVDKVVMSKFTLKYITSEALQSQASTLGLSNVQYVTTPQNPSVVYISAYPKELAKIKELISILDISSNIMSGSQLITSNFTSVDLENITASEFSGLLANLGLDAGIVLASRPYTLYTFVTGSALADIKTIKNIVDKPLTGANLSKGPSQGGSDVVVTNPPATTAPDTTAQGGSSTPAPDSGTQTPENQILREITLEYLTKVDALEILNSFPQQVTPYGPAKMTKKIWLLGTESEVNAAESRIKQFDTPEYTENLKLENQFFVYELKNYTAKEMMKRLENIDHGNDEESGKKVTYMSTGYSELTKSLIVYCDFSRQDSIKALLDALDTATTGEMEFRVVESTNSIGTATSRINILRELHPEIPADSAFEFKLVSTKDSGEAKCITFVKASTEMTDYIKALLNEMDEA